MQTIRSMAMAVAFVFTGIVAASASPMGSVNIDNVNAESGLLQQVQGRRCEELRQACEQKDRLGERGEGNCKTYRAECGRQRVDNCPELRRACLNKDRLGERGEGNCKTYREQCRGYRSRY